MEYPEVRATFISFINARFDVNWDSVTDERLFHNEKRIMWHMAKMRALKTGATIRVLDINFKEITLKFREASNVGIGNSMLYFNRDNVIGSPKVEDPPAEYLTPPLGEDLA